ncbi:uncharacterized protein JCM15063_001512 [Sporobolomyces koalae]|uniref:uncharacterized protein n=1 Tax=Sporobolomyces koalae TaxID=500713 RepID=UPI0031770A3E
MWWLTFIMRRLLYYVGLSAPVRTIHGVKPATIVSLDSTGAKRSTRLDEVLDQCPSLKGREAWYTPTTWLSSGHLATIFCTVSKFAYDEVLYTRESIRVPDGGTIGIDFTPRITEQEPIDDRPMLVCCHGLTGGSYESYIRNILSVVTKPKSEGGLGWRGAVINSRGCANTKITSDRLYNGGVTDDIRSSLAFISHFAPNAPLYGIGFSLGANQICKYAGEEGEQSALKAVISLGAPFDFVKGNVALSSSWIRRIYSRAMGANLKRLVQRHAYALKKHPAIDWDGLFGNPYTTLFEFDSLVTAPLGGFPTAIAYYRWASASNTIRDIRVPFLGISALDDPIVDSTGIPFEAAQENPYLTFAVTKHGGHLGWFSGLFRPRRWVVKPVVEWLSAIHEADPSPRQARPTEPAQREGKIPEIGDEMVLLKGLETVGFARVQEEVHEAQGNEPVDGVEELTQGL